MLNETIKNIKFIKLDNYDVDFIKEYFIDGNGKIIKIIGKNDLVKQQCYSKMMGLSYKGSTTFGILKRIWLFIM